MTPPPGKTRYVYVIGDPNQCVVKIGWSCHPRERLTQLQGSSPFPLTLWWATVGTSALEVRLHHEFKAQRLNGEWFEFPEGNAVARIKEAVAAQQDHAFAKLPPMRALLANGCTWRQGHGHHVIWNCPCGQHAAVVAQVPIVSPGVIGDVIEKLACLPEGWLQ